jgi:CRP/FNR family transcriptional regulator
MDLLAILAQHPYFVSLPPAVLKAVASRVVTRAYEKGGLVYLEGEPSQGLYLVASGSVRVFKASDDGREQDLHRLGPGQSFSDAAAFDGGPTIANAQATESSIILFLSRNGLVELLQAHPEIGVGVARVLASRLREVSSLAGDLSLRHVMARVAGVIDRLAGSEHNATLPARHELAAMVGTVREVATRALRELAKAGAIQLEPRGRVTIMDRAVLERLSGSALPTAPVPPWRPGAL